MQPTKPMLDKDGRQRRTDDGKAHLPILEWRNSDLNKPFSEVVIRALREQLPNLN